MVAKKIADNTQEQKKPENSQTRVLRSPRNPFRQYISPIKRMNPSENQTNQQAENTGKENILS